MIAKENKNRKIMNKMRLNHFFLNICGLRHYSLCSGEAKILRVACSKNTITLLICPYSWMSIQKARFYPKHHHFLFNHSKVLHT